MPLYTCNYSAFHPDMGVPVQTSNGKPKWPLRYSLIHAAPKIFPAFKDIQIADQDEFNRRYVARLEWITVDRIEAELNSIAQQAGDDRLVLLCFEDLSKGKWCHRTTFAQWWMQSTGEIVEELGRMPAEPEPDLQDPLF